jgi:4-phytase / acid phosphatase
MRSVANSSLLGLAIVLGTFLTPLLAQNVSAGQPKLKFAAILTRHGVRSPIRRSEELNTYSSESWPDWGVSPGTLTPHGRELMKLFGSYYRLYFSAAGLLVSRGCEDASDIHIRADVESRTRETGSALAAGLMPGCTLEMRVVTGEKDPLFSPVTAGIGKPDRALAVAAMSGRIGANPNALIGLYRPAFDTLREVLFGCASDMPCTAEQKPGKQILLKQASSVDAGGSSHVADLQGPFKIGSSLSEALLLEYLNGMEGKDLGWGRLNAVKLLEIMRIHAAYADLARQTPYVARIQASNLLSHILSSMQQAAGKTPVTGSLGKAGDRVLIIVGHDTNISNIAGMLGISWLLDGYQRDETPPGGALIFELWQQAGGRLAVRTYFIAQSLEQMRKRLPLSLESPPLKSPIFVPGCSAADELMTCTWTAFHRTIDDAIDPAFVKP